VHKKHTLFYSIRYKYFKNLQDLRQNRPIWTHKTNILFLVIIFFTKFLASINIKQVTLDELAAMNKGDNTQRILLLPGLKQNWIVRQFFHKISGYRKFITATFESTCVQTYINRRFGGTERSLTSQAISYNVTLRRVHANTVVVKNILSVCSLRYPACNAHAPNCHLCPARLYSIFPHYLIIGTVCVLISSTNFVWNISYSKKNWVRFH
jgi:hypothetical protein